jgi:glucose-1-phosphate thymidylyltransferase
MRMIEVQQGLKIACIEEVAYRMRYIDRDRLIAEARRFSRSEYGRYLANVSEQGLLNSPVSGYLN